METYNTNSSFKQYVDGFCKQYNLTVEEALQRKVVQEAEKYYKEKDLLVVGKNENGVREHGEIMGGCNAEGNTRK